MVVRPHRTSEWLEDIKSSPMAGKRPVTRPSLLSPTTHTIPDLSKTCGGCIRRHLAAAQPPTPLARKSVEGVYDAPPPARRHSLAPANAWGVCTTTPDRRVTPDSPSRLQKRGGCIRRHPAAIPPPPCRHSLALAKVWGYMMTPDHHPTPATSTLPHACKCRGGCMRQRPPPPPTPPLARKAVDNARPPRSPPRHALRHTHPPRSQMHGGCM
jgi:hypothetical protein